MKPDSSIVIRGVAALLVAAALACAPAAVIAQSPSSPAPLQSASGTAPDFRPSAELPFRKDDDGAGATAYGFLLLLVAAAAALLWLRRRRGGGAPLAWPGFNRPGAEQDLRILASRPLGPHGSVQLVRWGGKELLLGCTAQSIQVLDTRAVTDGGVQASSLPAANRQVAQP